MAQITVTEALAELNTISKRIRKKQEFILTYVSRQEALKDPLSKDGGSPEVIKREHQALNDLTKRHLRIRTAIQKKNHETMITVEGMTMSLAEWLTWRKEVAPTLQSFAQSVKVKIDSQRAQALRAGANVVAAGQEAKPTDIVVNVDEKEINEALEQFETILGTLDGLLSLKNATVTIEV